MRHKFSILIFVFICAAFSAAAATTYAQNAKTAAADEAMIRANLEQMVKGWNMKSGDDFAKPFAKDSDYVVINGMHIKGRAANARNHQRIFDTIYKDTEIKGTIEQIRFLRPDVALVHAVAEHFPKTDKTRISKGRMTLVMVKTNGKWEIAAFQNTQIQMPSPNEK